MPRPTLHDLATVAIAFDRPTHVSVQKPTGICWKNAAAGAVQ
jgi:hypothetical protein